MYPLKILLILQLFMLQKEILAIIFFSRLTLLNFFQLLLLNFIFFLMVNVFDQINSVAMGSSHAPVLANISLGNHLKCHYHLFFIG